MTNKMSDLQLERMLSREDVGLKDLRKKVFLAEDKNEDLKRAAVSHNFDLTYQEFGQVLVETAKKREKDLAALTYAMDLSLCFYAAIHDVWSLSSPDEIDCFEYARSAKIRLEQKLSRLEGYNREEQIRELRIYKLASTAVLWEKNQNPVMPSNDLAFLKEHIVERDTWRTFMKFSEAWRGQSLQQRRDREKNLPRLYEYGIEEYQKEKENNRRSQKELEMFLTEGLARVERNLMHKIEYVFYAVLVLLVLFLIFRK
jgi:hypothetical protein